MVILDSDISFHRRGNEKARFDVSDFSTHWLEQSILFKHTWKKCKLLNYLKWFWTSRSTLTSHTTNKAFIFFLLQKKNLIIKELWIFRTKMTLENLWCLQNERKEIRFLIHWVTSYPFQILWLGTLSSKQDSLWSESNFKNTFYWIMVRKTP